MDFMETIMMITGFHEIRLRGMEAIATGFHEAKKL